MSTLEMHFHHPLDDGPEPFCTDIFTVPGVSGVGWGDLPTLHLHIEDDSRLDREALARFLGYGSYAEFLRDADPIIEDVDEWVEANEAWDDDDC